MTGRELMETGLVVMLKKRPSSAVIYYQEKK